MRIQPLSVATLAAIKPAWAAIKPAWAAIVPALAAIVPALAAIVPALAAIAAVASLGACGRSHVSMLVLQPALLNARPYGGSVTVAGFAPTRPEFVEVAGQLKREVEQKILQSPGGAVQLREAGGGLVLTGEVADHTLYVTEGSRLAKCTDTVQVVQGTAAATEKVTRDCFWKWYDWRASLLVNVRVTSNQGQVLHFAPVHAVRSGKTTEGRDRPPPPPDGSATLDELRAVAVQGIAEIVAPTHVRVTATLLDCAQPAEDTCAAGVAQLAKSNYAGAIAAFTDAIHELEAARLPPQEVAKAYYDRGVVHHYGRWFDQAVADFQRAYQLDADNDYRRALDEVQAARSRHQKLVDQGFQPH